MTSSGQASDLDQDSTELGEVECEEHGAAWGTFVCNHIATALVEGQTVGFVCAPADDQNPFPDAWCEACETFLLANGGEWTDEGEGVRVPGGIRILCSDCYGEARGLAVAAGRLKII